MASSTKKVCIVGASGKLGQYMIQHCIEKGYTINGVCREQSVSKLDRWKDQINLFPGFTNDRDVIKRAVAGCQGVLVVLAPMGFVNYSSGTAQAVLDLAEPGARLIFSCGWHISKDGLDKYSLRFRLLVKTLSFIGWATRFADIDDQVEACRKIFESDTLWTVVRGSDLEEGESEGLPVWSKHVGDPILEGNLTRRIDYALFMVEALDDPILVKEAPAIVGCKTASALKYGTKAEN